jgi:glycosyltransferase involved in cell wall biosynthesis
MKIAFIYGPFSVGYRPIDFSVLESSPRGLTGSEMSCFAIARAMAARGHEVSLFVHQPDGASVERIWRGVRVYSLDKLGDHSFDAVYSWNEPDVLRGIPKGPERLVNQQLNDFSYCKPGFDEFVDIYTSPSEAHLEFIRGMTPDPLKWTVLRNGCDPSIYSKGKRVPGRVIWASSADRGLHLLLQAWPDIKRAVPHASLRAFYNFNYSAVEGYEDEPDRDPQILEIAQRVRYIKYAIDKLKDFDVQHVGSVSRARLVDEMNQAVVLGYPCETIRYSEGFSMTLMEACVAGVIPVTSDIDALGDIYGDAVPMVKSPVSERLDEFTSLVVRALTDKDWRVEVRKKTKALAAQHTWDKLAQRLEQILGWEKPKVKRRKAHGADLTKSGRAETYVNHLNYGLSTSRYWVTDRILVGGSIWGAEDWEHLKRDFGVTDVLSVESEHDDGGKGIESIRQLPFRDDGASLTVDIVHEALDFARGVVLQPGRVLYVHCWAAGSRSPSMAYAICRGIFGMDADQVLALIRAECNPTFGTHATHQAYIKVIEQTLLGRRATR